MSRRLKTASGYLFTQIMFSYVAVRDSTLERSLWYFRYACLNLPLKIYGLYIEQRDRKLERSLTPGNNLWCVAHLKTDI